MLEANAPAPGYSYRGMVRTWPQASDINPVRGQNVLAHWIVDGGFNYKGLRLARGQYIFYWPLVDRWHIMGRDPSRDPWYLYHRFKHLVYREPV